MTNKIIVGPINKGLRNDRTAFVIDNDSFPTIINAYQWRGRVKRKRGTSILNRLSRYWNSNGLSYTGGVVVFQLLDGSGNGNLLTGFAGYSFGTNAAITPGNVVIVDATTLISYTDPSLDGTLSPSGSINYSTGAFTIAAAAGNNVIAGFTYYPNLPVMGLEDLSLTSDEYPGTLGFDTKYSYSISTVYPFPVHDVTFYKNPATGSYPGYVQKTYWKLFTWNGQDYQQFWTVNYQSALWATNGIAIPFDASKVGMQFNTITNIGGVVAGPPAFATITTGTNHGLVIGDFVFINEVGGLTGINFQTGYVTAVPAANQITVEFPNATLGGAYTTGGIVQYLTNVSDSTKDCLKWYDGDPTNGNPTSPTFVPGNGWVNFCPPLSQSTFSIGNQVAAQYYLVHARMIIPFKDRLLFLGPVIQTSTGSPIYLQDTIIYSQNGTPYYTASFTGDPALSSTVFHPILVPSNQTASPTSYWEDQTGFGGFLTAGISQQMVTVSSNEDVLIIGFNPNIQSRLIYTGNDLVPFNLFIINSELGSSSTFSTINMDQGVITRGSRGFVITSQTNAQRIDLEIPDEVFEINLQNNGAERICSQRDYINEWIYFTYPKNQEDLVFPNQTLQYNYRDNSWAVFLETYTTYGSFRQTEGFTWANVGNIFQSWNRWNEPWNAGSSTLFQPKVIAGNQQGFVIFRDDGTAESISLEIKSISGSTVTSPNHNLNEDDFIVISGALGTIGPQVNGSIFQVSAPVTTDTFVLDPNIGSGTYLGNGTITRLYRPFIQTKQFPTAWGLGRKTRIGSQQYLFTTTPAGQIQLLIYLSQDSDNPYNDGPIVPSIGSTNNSLIYSTVVYTCPESTNLGLTPANINLQIPTSITQQQTWHRMNTSLIGDTVQIGFTISDEQMRALIPSGESVEITGVSQASPCVIDCTGQFDAGTFIKITDIVGMTELNNNTYYVISSTPTQITIQADSITFGAYISGGFATPVSFNNQFAEIELHGFILDVSPSQLLV